MFVVSPITDADMVIFASRRVKTKDSKKDSISKKTASYSNQ